MEPWRQLILQSGISALVLYVAFKIAMKLIDKWSATEEARTKVIGDGFAADIAAHQAIAKTMGEWMVAFTRLETKIDTAFDLTPVHGVRVQAFEQRSVIVDMDDIREEPDLQKTPPQGQKQRRTPPQGVPASGTYGPKRPKTHG